MQFMVSYRIKPEHRTAAISRFMETGGPPPDGVTMHGRWHGASGGGGFTLAEADSVEAVAAWCHQWADLLAFRIEPVMNDEEAARVFSS
jgi:hypothetical protein